MGRIGAPNVIGFNDQAFGLIYYPATTDHNKLVLLLTADRF